MYLHSKKYRTLPSGLKVKAMFYKLITEGHTQIKYVPERFRIYLLPFFNAVAFLNELFKANIGFHLFWHTVELAMSTRLCVL